MSKKKITLVITVLIVLLGAYFGRQKNVISKKSNQEVSNKLGNPKRISPPLKSDQKSQPVLTKGEIDFRDKYENAAYQLADLLEKNDLDGDELNSRFSKLGREEFLKTLPEEVKLGYLKLEETIKDYQETLRKEDGIHKEFFNRYQTEMPTHLKNQREALKLVSLPVNVESVVNDLVKKDQLKNEDINFILSECGKGNADCINKSFALLIEAHHSLSEDQISTIKEYL